MNQSTVYSPQSTARIIKSLLLSILSGVLLALPFCNGKLWVFTWVGFVPLFLALQNKSRAKAFVFSYLTGIIFWSVTIYWLIHVTLLGQVLLISYLALYFAVFGLLVSRIPYPVSLFFIPSLWVFIEYLRAHLLSGFGWALLGYSQYLNLPVIQIADLFGVYGVSFLVMMANILIYGVTGYGLRVTADRQKLPLPRAYFILSSLFLILSLGYGFYKLSRIPYPVSRIPLRISVIQGNIPQELKWDYGSKPFILDRYVQLTKTAAKARPDLIIWPEASNPGFLGEDQDRWISRAIFALAQRVRIPLLFGSVVREKEKYFNSALLIDGDGALMGRYDKLHLVPFGEYIPLKNIFRFLETIVPIGDFTAGKEYVLFKLSTISYQSSVKFAVLTCFEDTIPELSRKFIKKGADFLVNITNDAWFGKTSSPYQHLSASVFRAIENRVPLVRSANTGVSCFIDACGRITAKLSENGNDIFVQGVKTGSITLDPVRDYRATRRQKDVSNGVDKRTSPYSAIGDVFVLACLAIVGFYGIIAPLKIKKAMEYKPQI